MIMEFRNKYLSGINYYNHKSKVKRRIADIISSRLHSLGIYK